MEFASYDVEALRTNPNVEGLTVVPESLVMTAEQQLGRSLPGLIRAWCRDFGSLALRPARNAFLILLGMGSSVDDDITLFNVGNRALPLNSLAFAHEFADHMDTIYVLAENGCVLRAADPRVFPYVMDQPEPSSISWTPAYDSLEMFWKHKVSEYLA